MNAAQLQFGSAPASLDADRVGSAAGLSAEDRGGCRAAAVTNSDRREAHCGSAPTGESSHLLGQVQLTSGARVIFDEVGADSRPAQEIARRAGFVAAAVRRHLETLAAAGLVAQEGSGWRRA